MEYLVRKHNIATEVNIIQIITPNLNKHLNTYLRDMFILQINLLTI